MNSLPPILLKPSYRILAFSLIIHLGALGVFCRLPLTPFWGLLGGIFLLGSLSHAIGLHALQIAPMSIQKLWQISPHEWMWIERRGKVVKAYLLGDSLVTTGLIILNFRISWYQYRSVILCGDMLSSEEFRRLRLYLLVQSK